jgi:ribonuclease R
MDAVVTGVESFGLFVQGLELPAEGLVSLDSLPGDTYRYERASHTLSGRRQGNSFRLGDRVRVTVAKVDLERRTLDFRLVESHGRRPRGPAPRRPGSKPRGQGGRSRASGPGAAKRSQRSGRKQKRQR